ncbi:hypothetical protein DIPPA_02552 [Diplonema papillatum]|nr:hypothetical protein DIPPA_02552 [Diplonema papillatum]
MGKAKKTKPKAVAKAPDLPECPLPQDVQQVKMVPAVKRLTSDKRNERWQGACDVAALALEKDAIPTLAACGAVAGLSQLLGDSSASVRLVAVRALENLILNGEAPQAESFLTKHTPATLKALLKTALEQLASAPPADAEKQAKSDKKQGDAAMAAASESTEGLFPGRLDDDDKPEPADAQILGEIAIELVQLVSAAAYFVEAVVDAFSGDAEFLEMLLHCLPMHGVCSSSSTLAIAAAELLLVICEDNDMALHTLRSRVPVTSQKHLIDTLQQPAGTPNQNLVQVTCSGLLRQLDASTVPAVVDCLIRYINDINPHRSCESLLTEAGKRKGDKPEIENVVTEMKVMKSALEISANIICGAEEGRGDDDDEEEAFRKSAIGALIVGKNFGGLVGVKAAVVLAPCANPHVDKALRNCIATPLEAVQEEYDQLERAMIVLLLDLMTVLPLAAVGSPPALWSALQSVFARDAEMLAQLQERRAEDPCPAAEGRILSRLQNLSTCLWTVLRKSDEDDTPVDVPFVGKLITFTRQRRQGPAVANADFFVSILRFLAEALQRIPKGDEFNWAALKQGGQLCMDFLKDESLATNVEAANCIVDVFSNDEWNDVMQNLNMLRHLKEFSNVLSQKLALLSSTGQSISDDLAPRVELVVDNIQPFIDYKQSALPKPE